METELMHNEIGVQTVTPLPNDPDYEEVSLPPLKLITPNNHLRSRHFDFNPEVIKPRILEEPTAIQKAQIKLEKIRKDENRSKKLFQEYQIQAIKMIHIQRKKDEVTFIQEREAKMMQMLQKQEEENENRNRIRTIREERSAKVQKSRASIYENKKVILDTERSLESKAFISHELH
jgi:hypothetical protein